jgi:multiple sugar transport system substrate-binding protein
MQHTGPLTRRSFIGLAAAGLSLPVLAACGGSDDGSTGDNTTANNTGGANTGGGATGTATGPTGAATTSAASPPAVKGSVTIMGFSTSDEVGTSRVAYAQKQDPNLKINVDKNGFDQQKFATAIAGGSPPEGVYMDRQLLATYAAKGFIVPLDDYISKFGIDMSQYYDQAVKESTYQGKIYGIPDFYTTRSIFVNNRIATAAGLTVDDVDTSDWDKLTTVATKMYKATGGKPSCIGYDPKLPEYLPLWAMANGGSIVDADGKPTLDDSKVVEALTYTVSLVNAQGGWADFKSFRDTWDFFGADNEFVKDQIGAMDYEQWYVNVLAGFAAKTDLSATQFKGKDGKPLTFESGSAFAICKGSGNPDGLAEFAKQVTSQGAWAAAADAREAKVTQSKSLYTGIFSANKPANDAANTKYIKPNADKQFSPIIKVFNDALDFAQMIPPSPAGQEIQAAYQQACTSALGGKDAASALKSAQSQAMSAYSDATG